MSSAVIPDENATGEFDEFADDSAQSPEANVEPDFLRRSLPVSEEATERREKNNSFSAGRKNLRDTLAKNAKLGSVRRDYISNLAKTKYADLGLVKGGLKAQEDYKALVATAAATLRAQQPTMDPVELQYQAEQQVLSTKSPASAAASAVASKGKKLLKKGAEKAVTYVGNIVFPGLGSVLRFLIFTKYGRLILVLSCFCCFTLFIDIYQTFASEDKWKTISESANLVACAGGTDQSALTKCLFDQKVKEYSLQEPKPE